MKNEVLKVKALGEEIGYGFLMEIASALWDIAAEQYYGTKVAYLAISSDCISKQSKELLIQRHELIIKEMKQYLDVEDFVDE